MFVCVWSMKHCIGRKAVRDVMLNPNIDKAFWIGIALFVDVKNAHKHVG